MYVAKTKALISFAVSAKLICVFVFAYAIRWFSHDVAHIEFTLKHALQGKNPISLDNSQCPCAFQNSLFAG